jgi:solute carrier family 26 (sodium-independent sulfate anion transporter), member 11
VDTEAIAARPTLRAIVLDFSAVNYLDVTAAQALVDLRNQFNRYAEPDRVEWHFAGISNRWTKRALVAAGFGADRGGSAESNGEKGSTGPLIAVGGAVGDSALAEVVPTKRIDDIEVGEISPVNSTRANARLVPLYGINRPYFHVDLETALKSTVHNLEGRASESS